MGASRLCQPGQISGPWLLDALLDEKRKKTELEYQEKIAAEQRKKEEVRSTNAATLMSPAERERHMDYLIPPLEDD